MNSQSREHAYLCVGGPFDGKRFCTRELFFRVMEQPPFAFTFKPDNEPPMPSEVHMITYVADRLRSTKDPADDVWFWRPDKQSAKKTMELLLERYEQSHSIIFAGQPYRFR